MPWAYQYGNEKPPERNRTVSVSMTDAEMQSLHDFCFDHSIGVDDFVFMAIKDKMKHYGVRIRRSL